MGYHVLWNVVQGLLEMLWRVLALVLVLVCVLLVVLVGLLLVLTLSRWRVHGLLGRSISLGCSVLVMLLTGIHGRVEREEGNRMDVGIVWGCEESEEREEREQRSLCFLSTCHFSIFSSKCVTEQKCA